MSRKGFQWADTIAAKMLLSGLERAKEQTGLSVRQAAKQLGYKQAVVLSHMASGRAPIPIDRAEDIAGILEMSPRKFLRAVFQQRHPDVKWELIAGPETNGGGDAFGKQLEVILDAPLSDLNAEQRRVLREVAAETKPERRWLSVQELPAVEHIRANSRSKVMPDLSDEEVDEILSSLDEANRETET